MDGDISMTEYPTLHYRTHHTIGASRFDRAAFAVETLLAGAQDQPDLLTVLDPGSEHADLIARVYDLSRLAWNEDNPGERAVLEGEYRDALAELVAACDVRRAA